MGQAKGGGYVKKGVFTKKGDKALDSVLGQALQSFKAPGTNLTQNPLYQQAVQGTQQFLPGGQGFQPIQAEAQRQFQQQTIPSILNAFGSNAKSSSALNQALASAGQDLNTSLASQLAQMQLGASGQAAQLAGMPFQQGLSAAQLGLGTQPFAYMQRQTPFWQQALLGGIQAGGQVGGALLGKPPGL
jgi:hypothetical protein